MTKLTDYRDNELEERLNEVMPTRETFLDILNIRQQQASDWSKLMEIAGDIRDGSQATIKLYQDDATNTCHVQVDGVSHWGNSFSEALSKF